MYIAYSWPKVLSTPSAQGQYVHVHLDQTYFIAVAEWSVQIWSSGRSRLRLGYHILSEPEVAQYGHHLSACWCSQKNCLAALVRIAAQTSTEGAALVLRVFASKDA